MIVSQCKTRVKGCWLKNKVKGVQKSTPAAVRTPTAAAPNDAPRAKRPSAAEAGGKKSASHTKRAFCSTLACCAASAPEAPDEREGGRKQTRGH